MSVEDSKDDVYTDPVSYVKQIIAGYRTFPLLSYSGGINGHEINEEYAKKVRELLDAANIPFELEFKPAELDETGALVGNTAGVKWSVGAVTTYDEATKTFSERPLILSANKV